MRKLLLGIVLGLVLPITNCFAVSYNMGPSVTNISQLNLKFKTVVYDADSQGPITSQTKNVAVYLVVTNDSPYNIDALDIIPMASPGSSKYTPFSLANYGSPLSTISGGQDSLLLNSFNGNPPNFWGGQLLAYSSAPVTIIQNSTSIAVLPLKNVSTNLPITSVLDVYVTAHSSTAGIIFAGLVIHQGEVVYTPGDVSSQITGIANQTSLIPLVSNQLNTVMNNVTNTSNTLQNIATQIIKNTCTPKTCTATYQCGSTVGVDNCGNTCTTTAGTCSLGKTCGPMLHQCL
jgi:hypothetical protein